MCGILCAFNIKQPKSKLRPQVLEMSKKLRHRGPDWSGIYDCEKIEAVRGDPLCVFYGVNGGEERAFSSKNYIIRAIQSPQQLILACTKL